MGLKRCAAASAAALTLGITSAQLMPAAAVADDLHNVTYRARVDGIARGALITYKINDTQVSSADPTMLPGRTFEANAVLTDPTLAGMQISIQWPYSANLHCEILVDDAIVAQADTFIAPRLTPARDDPDYGALECGAPLINPVGVTPDTPAADTPAPEVPAPEVPAPGADPANPPNNLPPGVDPPPAA
ncbi:MAG: hypothetical protein U0R81_10410 [Mycobacterium sp.]